MKYCASSPNLFFFLIVFFIPVLFLVLNLLFSPHTPYQEKSSAFECGFHSFSQSRLPFNISFYLYGILFLLFDLEIFLVFPYALSSSHNQGYGLYVLFIFLLLVTLGFIFELGKGALHLQPALIKDEAPGDDSTLGK